MLSDLSLSGNELYFRSYTYFIPMQERGLGSYCCKVTCTM